MIGLDVIRCYELYWLNTQRNPQVGLLEINLDTGSGQVINTYELKNYLDKLSTCVFNNVNALSKIILSCKEIAKFSECVKISILPAEKFYTTNGLSFDIDYCIDSVVSLDDTLYPVFKSGNFLSNQVRFICKKSGQPFLGSVRIIFTGEQMVSPVAVLKHLITLRNTICNEQEYVEQLLFLMQQQNNFNDCIISVHLARKGGISYQGIRSISSLVDLTQYIMRMQVE